MAIYNKNELFMFAKWHGTGDLLNNDDFWLDCKKEYIGNVFTLPYEDSPAYRSIFQCHYNDKCMAKYTNEYIPLSPTDIKILNENARQRIHKIQTEKGIVLDIKDGCQFEKNGICTAMQYRPYFCQEYPVIEPFVSASENGSYFSHICVVAASEEIFDDIRSLYIYLASKNNAILLLPDLSIIPSFEKAKEMFNV